MKSRPPMNSPSPRSSIIIAFVGGYEPSTGCPGDRVGLTSGVDDLSGELNVVVFHRVGEMSGRACRPVPDDRTGRQVDDDDVVIFLERDSDLIAGIDADVLGFGIVGKPFGQPCQRYVARRPVRRDPDEIDDGQEPGRTRGISPSFTSSSR